MHFEGRDLVEKRRPVGLQRRSGDKPKDGSDAWDEGENSDIPFKTLGAPETKIIEKEDDDAACSHRCSGYKSSMASTSRSRTNSVWRISDLMPSTGQYVSELLLMGSAFRQEVVVIEAFVASFYFILFIFDVWKKDSDILKEVSHHYTTCLPEI